MTCVQSPATRLHARADLGFPRTALLRNALGPAPYSCQRTGAQRSTAAPAPEQLPRRLADRGPAMRARLRQPATQATVQPPQERFSAGVRVPHRPEAARDAP